MQTILCIPGPWASRTEFTEALIRARLGEYIFAGNILAQTASDTYFLVELYEADPELLAAFERAGRFTAMSEESLATVAEHKMVAYLLTQPDETADCASARALARAATALLDAGGLAVKVETAGKAFEAAKWRELVVSEESGPLWELFVAVAISAPKGASFSCGMHNLGLKDALVHNLPTADAIHLLQEFTYFEATEQPQLGVGHTFSLATDALVYRLAEVAQQPYADHPDFANPYGMWELVTQQPSRTTRDKLFSKN